MDKAADLIPEIYTQRGLTNERERIPVGKLALALSKARKAFKAIPKDRSVTVKTKKGGQYSFKYATLDAINDAIVDALEAHELAVVQTLDGLQLTTTLIHSSGESLSSSSGIILPDLKEGEGPGNQDFGSAVTYMRRYQITALLNICADEDDDGNLADGNEMTEGQAFSIGDAVRGKPTGPLTKAHVELPETLPPFGRQAKEPIQGQPIEVLSFYREAVEVSMNDASKARFYDKNAAMAQALDREIVAVLAREGAQEEMYSRTVAEDLL